MADEEFDKNKIAVALTYERGIDESPKMAAKGKGLIAERIIELAKANGVEIKRDEDLAVMLEKLDIDMPIPVEAYVAVAEILAFVYKQNAKKKFSLNTGG